MSNTLSKLQSDIISTLVYYDIFDYPLKLNELLLNSKLSPKPDKASFVNAINELKNKNIVNINNDLYAINKSNSIFKNRLSGNELAEKLMPKAIKRSKFIAAFPFVKAVYLSGSISKGYMAEDGDIDFFIIAESGRLWIARTLLILFKKIFLLNSYKTFCVNYFIDDKNLEIEEKNLFTATELVTLIPTYDYGIHMQFKNANKWANDYFPNNELPENAKISKGKRSLKKALFELPFYGKLGDKIDTFFLNLTLRKWQKKFGYLPTKEFDIALKSRPYVSKHHPQNFQKRVLDTYAEKCRVFEKEYSISLS